VRVRIEWCGHSYIILKLENGMVIAIDPHDGGSVGLPKCEVKANYTLITHDHYDHNAAEVSGGKVIKKKIGEFRLGGEVIVRGYKFYHDKASGKLRGDTAAYLIEIGDLRIAHMGDLGHVPPPGMLKPFEAVDLLALPVGGTYTIDAFEATAIIEMLKPKLVLPIHYWIPGMILPLDPLDRLLNITKARRVRIEEGVIELEGPPPGEGKPSIVIPERTVSGARVFP
jgi:L-ascorbate metabolism protein UlaG (beta-lactamase superfamily)